MNIYDEAIETFHNMHPEYDTANGGTHLLHDKVLNALKRAKKVEELLTYQNHYIDSIVIELDRVTNKAKASQIEIIKKELEELK